VISRIPYFPPHYEVFMQAPISTPRGEVRAFSQIDMVSERRNITIVLPAYNEAANLPKLLDRIRVALVASGPYRVLVVDDGSTDETQTILAEYATRMPLTSLRHERNLGLGPTIRDCLSSAVCSCSDDDIVVSMDADQSHNPGLIPRMAQLVSEGVDVVIASRYRSSARVCGLVLRRRFISWGASLLLRCLFPTAGVRDYTCGFRAYRGAVLKEAFTHYGPRFVDQEGCQCMVDILLKLRKMNRWILGEVPMILRYDLKEGATKMRIIRTGLATLRVALRSRFQAH
jgi:dolichol-phosphate mannosyltransferase